MKRFYYFLLLITPVILIAQSESTPPNIICIFVDDLGYGDLSFQDADDMQTPNIDSFAANGLHLTNFYANCTVCSPSRAALLTGRYPDMVGVPGVIRQNEKNSWGHLSQEAILLPQVLKSRGYHSAIIGKWHLGLESPNTPTDRGFDFFHGFLGDMMDDYWNHLRGGINWMRKNQEVIEPVGHATDIFTDWTIAYLEERKNLGAPFFLYLSYNAPHFPIQPPDEWLEKVKEREPHLSEKRMKNVAFIEHLDYNVGRVLDKVEALDMDQNTLIIFTSDNGGAGPYEQSNGPLRGAKQHMYEGGIKVPAYVQWPGKIEPGTSSNNFAMHMDFLATVADLIDVPIYHKIDGISILPTLLGKHQETGQRTVFWMRREGGRYGGQSYYAARHGDFKIMQNSPYDSLEYFNLKEDPYETTPLKKEGETYRRLRAELQEHIRQTGAVKWRN